MKDRPQARVDVKRVDIGSELMIYDERRHVVHLLNSTARYVLEMCDGTHEVEEISEAIHRLFPQVADERVRLDVEDALRLLGDSGVIVWISEEVEQAP